MTATNEKCPYCGDFNRHYGQLCHRIKAIKYHQDGTIKRVELAPTNQVFEVDPYIPEPKS